MERGKAGTEMEARYKNFNRIRHTITGIYVCCCIVVLVLIVVTEEGWYGWESRAAVGVVLLSMLTCEWAIEMIYVCFLIILQNKYSVII